MSTSQAIQAQQLHEPTLLSKANVVGVAVGFKETKGGTDGELSVVVLVEQKKPLAALSAQDVIPPELEGMRTDVYEVGYLRALQTQDPKGRFRPIISPGVSIGHFKVTAGTFGAFVTDKSTGERLILSNNHVLANSNDALIGDAILQPGAIDGGKNPGDAVATLERFIQLRFTDEPVSPPPTKPPTPNPDPPPTKPPTNPGSGSGSGSSCDIVDTIVRVSNAVAALLGSQKRVSATTLGAQSVDMPTPVMSAASSPSAQAEVPTNLVDAALAKPVNSSMFIDQSLQIGKVSGTKPASLGMRVRKFGRTTGYTEGNITLLNATVNVAYNTMVGTRTARFTGTIITQAMSQGGDSGSLIVDASENRAVGLLFAGSELATIFVPIETVLSQLNVTI